MVLRQTLHEIVDGLPDETLPEAARLLNALVTYPLPRAFLEAEEDDEPVTAEDIAALEEARAERERCVSVSGDFIPVEPSHDRS